MTTEVSKTPRLASVIGVRINYCSKIRPKLSRIDPCGSARGIGDSRARYKAAPPNWSQFSDRSAVSANNEGSSGFDLTKHCGGLIAKFALGDGTIFHAHHCSICSTL